MKSVLMLFFQFILVGFLTGQEINRELISSSGNTFINQTYQLDWSLGEIMIETYSKHNNIHLQGFHQFEFLQTTVELPLITNPDIKVFPNPVTEFIHFEIKHENIENWMFEIIDSKGICLFSDIISEPQQTLNISYYPAGTYFLNFLNNFLLIKTFIIIKK